MQAKVISVNFNGQEQVVRVRFFEPGVPGDNEEVERHVKTYYLKEGKAIEDLYPAIKDDLEEIEAGFAKAAELSATVGTPIDLTGVPSAKAESKKRFEEQAKKEQEEREARLKEQEEKAAEEVTPEV